MMKLSGFAIFLSIVLSLYALINTYIFIRGWQALRAVPTARVYYLVIMLVLILAYPAGRFLESAWRSWVSTALIFVGAVYLAFMVYFFLILIGIDVVRVVNRIFNIFTFSPRQMLNLFRIVIVIIALTILGGYLNALFPRVRHLEINIPKNPPGFSQLNMVVVSDIHLGTIVRNGRLKKIVRKINQLQPDLVLIPGDIVDEDIAPVREARMADILAKIKSRYGVFAVTGNHEYFSGVQKAMQYIEESGIKILQDEAILVANAFYVIGRRDYISNRFGEHRKPLSEIMKSIGNPHLPIFLMDHQPLHLEQAEETGVDLQLSGHTHHGQMFPFNLITKKVYEVSWGYKKKGNTQYYVSCGVGTWGPPVRIGNTPEIVDIKIDFNPRRENE